MKITLLIFACSIIFCQTVFSQSDSVQYELHYRLMGNKEEQNLLVLISKDKILEKDYKAFQRDSTGFINIIKTYSSAKSPLERTLGEVNNFGRDGEIIFDFKKNKMLYFRWMGPIFYDELSLPEYKWTISAEKRIIAGYNCTRATGVGSKGSVWDVWFTDHMQFSAGLLGMNNLPGVVIKATETTTHADYELTGAQKGSLTFKNIELPDGAIEISPAEMTKDEEEMKKDKNGFIKAQLASHVIVIKHKQ